VGGVVTVVALGAGVLANAGSTPRGGASQRGRPTRTRGAAQIGPNTTSPGARQRHTREAAQIDRANEAEESPQVRHLIAQGKPIYCGGPKGDEIALTFDDGPGTYTRLAISKLHKHRIKATFFVVGRNIPLLPDAIREERRLGAVGDHTFTHPVLTSLAPKRAEAEIVHTQTALERAGAGGVFLFRPPYGAHDARVDAIARRHNLLEILWTVDSRDSLGANYEQIERNAIAGMHPGAIVLMHENRGQTIRAMLSIFAALERKHLRTVSVAKLLTDDPPSDTQVKAGGLGCGASASAGSGGG
jgi:peptidoglycan/xylan/chitin deacetylase (PgdA/CDA1 family)